ncbi:DUF3037 domain-containing protein [Azospirillum doebereinerae]|nr:DUF3037 domain-containing protein [Azospirillum doebereinerae]MCG5241899.1 DUF3037 domain-containing protein [Azospirillum doebereinerae]
MRSPYTYTILRYRHDSVAGELVNVGVLLHEPASGFLDLRIRHSSGRLRKLYTDLDHAALRSSLQSVERGVKELAKTQVKDLFGKEENAGGFASKVFRESDGCLVWSDLGSGTTENPDLTLDRLFYRFVAKHDEITASHRDDQAVWRPVREKLVMRNLANRLQPKVIVSTLDRVEFEHSWKNGAWHCYQALSFDLASSEGIRDKARKWAGQMVSLSDAPEQFRPYFFVGKPSDESLKADYSAALKILERSPCSPEVYEESQIEDFVDRIEDAMHAHDASSH